MNRPRPFGWISAATLAAACLLAAMLVGEPVWLPVVALVAGLALAVAAGVGMVEWIVSRWVELLRAYRQATSISERVALLKEITRMDAEQMEFAKRYVPRLEMAAGDAGPAMFLRVVNDTIPLEFVRMFIEEGEEDWLCPVRQYSEGSLERKWAEGFTSWCIWMGYAAEAGGNRPARWIARGRAMKALGLIQ